MRGEFQRRLNLRQRHFIEEYLLCDDVAEAAVRAGYICRQPANAGHRVLANPLVRTAIRVKLDARAERTRVTADRVVIELARIAFSDIGQIADWGEGGLTLRPKSRLGDADRAAVARLTARKGHVSVALHDKNRALDTLGKYFKLWGKHADKFGPPAGGDPTARQTDAREALRERIEKLIAARDTVERDEKLREEAAWSEEWRRAFGET
jgi:phage terminase small subunit